MGPFKESLSLFCYAFDLLLFICASFEWFPFLSVTSITKFKLLHRVASRAITDCLLFSFTLGGLPDSFHFFSFEQTFCLPFSFYSSGSIRREVKPKLFRSSRKDFATAYVFVLLPSFSREALLTALLLLRFRLFSVWSLLFLLHLLALTLILAKMLLFPA